MSETNTNTKITPVVPAESQAQVVKDSIKAFSLTPQEGFAQMNPHSMLFDHTLISSDSSSPIKFRCGNTMALSAPGKGLPGSKQAIYKTFFNQHGKDITKAWVKTVNEVVRNNNGGELFKDKKNPEAPWTYKTITSAKQKKKKDLPEGEVDPKESIVTSIFDTVISEIEGFCEKEIFNHPTRNFPVKDDEEQKKNIVESLKKFGEKLKKKDVFRIDKTYQIIFFNDLWGTQGFGGFDVENTKYDGFKIASLDENRGIVNDEGLFKKYIEQSINNVDVLFLCESVRLNDSLEGYNHITIESDSVNGKSYSAICKGNNNIEISVATLPIELPNLQICKNGISSAPLNPSDFGIFDIKKDSQQIRVMVVHMDETFEGWTNMISWCKNNQINYIVGDTNITMKKKNTTAESFFTNLKLSGIYSKNKIEKLRQGNSKTNDVNGFLNNQINKGNVGTTEIDGMVILNISSAASSAVDTSPADTTGAAGAAADEVYQPKGTARVVADEVKKIRNGLSDIFSGLTRRKPKSNKNMKGGKRKKRTKRKNRKKNSKKRTKRKK